MALLNANKLCELLDVTPETLAALVARGLPEQPGKTPRYDPQPICRWLYDELQRQPDPPAANVVETLAAVARHFKVDRRTVADWRHKDMPGTDGAWDLDDIREWRQRTLQTGPASDDPDDPETARELLQLRRREQVASTELKELKLQRELREVIAVDEVSEMVLHHVQTASVLLEQLPDKLLAYLGSDKQTFRHKAVEAIGVIKHTLATAHEESEKLTSCPSPVADANSES